MYATPAQNLVTKIIYAHPFPIMNTYLIVRPTAVNGQDIYKKDRCYTN